MPTLVDSLSCTALGSAYVNPHNPDDRELSLGDWVWGKPGGSNSKHVRSALDALASQDITVPIWDEASGSGQNTKYHVAGFARVRLQGYELAGRNRIHARFLGYVVCNARNQPPAASVDPDQAAWLNLKTAVEDAFHQRGGFESHRWV